MTNLRDRLAAEPLSPPVIMSAAIDSLLRSMQIVSSAPIGDGGESGTVTIAVVENALGVFALNLVPPGIDNPRPYQLGFRGPPGGRTGFRLAVSLSAGAPKPLFSLIEALPSRALTSAVRTVEGDSEFLTADGGSVSLTGTDLFLVVEGTAGGGATLRLSPNREAPDDVVTLAVSPPTVLLGSSGFGFEFTHGLVVDLSDDAAPPARAAIDGVELATPADVPSWRGIAINRGRLYLPTGVPFIGGHAVDAVLQLGLPPTPGVSLVVDAKVPRHGDRPQIDVHIECLDPAAGDLGALVPTLVEAVMDLPLKGRTENFGQAVTFGGGTPVRARLRYARTAGGAAEETSEVSLALESQGPDGLVKVDSSDGSLGAKAVVTAATLATALIADQPQPDADASGAALHTLLVAAVGLSSFLERGEVVLHGAELVTSGGALPVGKVRLKIDYSVAAVVTAIDVGVMSVQMRPDQPLRIRVREVVLTIDPDREGLKMIHLDYTRSSLEVEDPGGWQVHGPDSIFDVLGTRSGRGSMWIEVDLRFKVDLGPVKVSGATIRATLDPADGHLAATIRGLEASLSLAGVIEGGGAVELTEKGFRAALEASLPTVGVAGQAGIETDGDIVRLSLGIDLPGPLPLGNSGLGIYGIGGVFVANGRPRPVPPGADPIQAQLEWDYTKQGAFVPAAASSLGLEAVIGTAPDLGFTFSARAGLFLTTPDIAVRGSLEGVYLGPRMTIARGGNQLSALQAKGVVVVDPADGVTIAVSGTYKIPFVVETVVPVGAHFPIESADWFMHLGSDGFTPPGRPSESREGGPVRSILMPEILGQVSDAYLMFRGNGITNWPRGGPTSVGAGVFVAAFGVGFDVVYGLRGLLWADVFAQVDILIATHPLSFVGMGRLGGGLHVGPFSIGVEARVLVALIDGAHPHVKAEICGTINLLFHEIHKCFEVEYLNEKPEDMPPPSEHPLAGDQSLVDGNYHRIAALATSRAAAQQADAVWPDSIPLLTFSTAPTLPAGNGQFPDLAHYPEGLRALPFGSYMVTYDWTLQDLRLVDDTDPAAPTTVAGQLSCGWQVGKHNDAAVYAQPAELALLTPLRDLWVHAAADATTGPAAAALGTLTNVCALIHEAQSGWAFGGGARRTGDAYRLPPDPIHVDPLRSQVAVSSQLFLDRGEDPAALLDYDHLSALAPHQAYTGPRVRTIAQTTIDGHLFDAWFDPGAALLPPGSSFGQLLGHPMHELRLNPADDLTDTRLWVVVEQSRWGDGPFLRSLFSVTDDRGASWQTTGQAELDETWLAVQWTPPGDGAISAVRVRWPVGLRLGVLGVRGLTAAAIAAAAARDAAAQNEAAKQREVSKDRGTADPAPSPTRRCLLQPDRVYRVDVDMAWSGTLFKENDQGTKEPYLPQALTPVPVRSFWFRTAAQQNDVITSSAHSGTVAHFEQLHRRQSGFDPAMLERYLLGYEPQQSELHRLAHDSVRVSFAPGHVAALAALYGFELGCGLRRLDQPDSVEPDRLLNVTLEIPTSAAHLGGSAKAIADAYLASGCGLAPDGVVMHADGLRLAPESWYEVFAVATSHSQGVASGRLPGVSFRTSRWADGSELMAGIGFPGSGAARATGGVALSRGTVLSSRTSLDDDGQFEAFLDDIGLDGWPSASQPRTSLLWVEDGPRWRCAGVLVEAPEPIHRPGRFEVTGLQLSMLGIPVPFDVALRDRSGSRLLFATSAPFAPRLSGRLGGVPRVTPRLRLTCQDRPLDGPAVVREGLLEVPLQPSFAEEA